MSAVRPQESDTLRMDFDTAHYLKPKILPITRGLCAMEIKTEWRRAAAESI